MPTGRRVWGVVAAGLLAAALPLVGGATGGAQVEATMTVVKVVTGDPPAGTTFTVTVGCIGEGSVGTGSSGSSTSGSTTATSSTTAGTVHAATGVGGTIVFNAQGQVISGTNSFSPPSAASSCTVTEMLNGGAQTVTYACSVQQPAGVSQSEATTCQGNQTVDFPEDPVDSATITITNAFPPAPLVVEPAFTG